jgi:curved DNA-binding protein CbpA
MAGTPTDDDYYEVLQISPNAEPDTVNRVYRLLAQRFHPDNKQTGNDAKFRQISNAYNVLSDPAQRARYDVSYNARRKDRVRLASNATQDENDFDAEQLVRLAVLEILYTRRRTEPNEPGVYILDLEQLLGRPREHLQFTMWYLNQKEFLRTSDDSRLTITAAGVEYLEGNYQAVVQRKRLPAAKQS